MPNFVSVVASIAELALGEKSLSLLVAGCFFVFALLSYRILLVFKYCWFVVLFNICHNFP